MKYRSNNRGYQLTNTSLYAKLDSRSYSHKHTHSHTPHIMNMLLCAACILCLSKQHSRELVKMNNFSFTHKGIECKYTIAFHRIFCFFFFNIYIIVITDKNILIEITTTTIKKNPKVLQ